MRFRFLRPMLVIFAAGFFTLAVLHAQQAPPSGPPVQIQSPDAQPLMQPAVPAAANEPEVLTRGPVHEAFATPTTDPVQTNAVPKPPPPPLEEMPPDTKPDGDVTWIKGYWAWDDDRNDYIWVSGVWRAVPPGRTWVAGYWKDDSGQYRWVPGFWAAAPQGQTQQVSYLSAPPAAPAVAPPGTPPAPDSFFVPGAWYWNGDRYVWQAGYWAHVQPGYVWVPGHYRWTPGGYIYIAGYWDLAVANRGVMYAPVYVDPVVVMRPGFVYVPAYAVPETVVIDTLFVRPSYCHYYYGDYYGVVYRDRGFESCIVYTNRYYDPVFTYARWEHRSDPTWVNVHLDIYLGRQAGRYPCPPRTLVEARVWAARNPGARVDVVVPAAHLELATRARVVRVDPAAREAYRAHAVTVQRVAMERSRTEYGGAPRPGSAPRTASLNVQAAHPAGYAAASAVHPNVAGQKPLQKAPARPPVRPAPSHRPEEKREGRDHP